MNPQAPRPGMKLKTRTKRMNSVLWERYQIRTGSRMGLSERSSTQDGGDEKAGGRQHIDGLNSKDKASWF